MKIIMLLCLSCFVTASDAHWPSFRGPNASGIADGQNLPADWDVTSGKNIAWRLPIAGLSHASPIVWGDSLFVTSAESSKDDVTFKPGLYGSGDAADDANVHRWVVYRIDAHTGKVVWRKVAHEGIPKSKRHIKATQNNATPATDGKHVIAHFGSEGVFCFDYDGNVLWRYDLGILDVGAYDAPTYEWGPASSPFIYKGSVILQTDTQQDDSIIALDIQSGKVLWKTARDEFPSWGTPNVFEGPKGAELVANGSNFIMGYDPASGKELWRMGGSSNITAPTPIFADGLIIVASGRRPVKPIIVIRPGSRGDITLPEGETSSAQVAWYKQGAGPYMPTPIAYKGNLYSLNNNGVFDCYRLASGEELYRQRVAHGGSGFSASPVASDDKIFLPGEDGDVFVVRTGNKYETIATNNIGEVIMASPAISHGKLYIRGRSTLFAVGGSK